MRFDNVAPELATGRVEQSLPDDLLETVFSGRSNVGKFPLINELVNWKALARVSATPGRTDATNFYGLADCQLVDLPGYGYAKVSQSEKLWWANLVEGYFPVGRRIGLVVQIVDMCCKPTADDLYTIDFLSAGGFPFVVVMAKNDKLNKGERIVQIQLYDDLFQNRGQVRHLPSSSTNGEGLDTLKEWITAVCAVQE